MLNIDYVAILIIGYFNRNNQKHLQAYFRREFKKAKDEYYEPEEFRDGLIAKLNSWSEIIDMNKKTRPNEAESIDIKFENSTFRVDKDIISVISDAIEEVYQEFAGQSKTPVNQQTDKEDPKNEITIRQKVESAFEFMQEKDPRKGKLILGEKDYNNLIDWITYYFENNMKVPNIPEPIKKVYTSKGNVVFTFRELFKELFPNHTMQDSLFELIKSCFFEYRQDKISNLRKTNEPQLYNDLISKYKKNHLP